MRSEIFASEMQSFFLLKHVKCLHKDKTRPSRVLNAKVTVSSVAVATTKFPFGMCNGTVESDVGKGVFSLELGILHVTGHAHVRSHVSLGRDW